jgi:acetyl-CoA carboxylase biotin carboxylase subunit
MKILVANRGEIAVRVMRACRDMGVATVAVYSDCDRTAPHVRYADEAVALGANPPGESYLRIDKIIDAARRTKATAIHPGYGFLAENSRFARACRDAGLTFVGPSPEVMDLLGGKTAAREVAVAAGAPVVPGTDGPVSEDLSDAELIAVGATIGYPLMVKAVAGGGGKGMRVVHGAEQLVNAVRTARSEARTSFGDASIFFERRLLRPRHVEIQVLGDEHGTVLPFVEQECSIQRRHQKVIEETPSIAVTPQLRERIAGAAAAVTRRAGYTNAGTVEFLLDEDGSFYFLEVNTRLQVEHPVTEMVTGLDLVEWQIRVARGERLKLDPDRLLAPRGHALECRVYAEDPEQSFMPAPGLIRHLRAPSGPGIRDDSGVAAGFEVPIFYDSLISKVIAWGEDRAQAISRMARALSEYEVGGLRTTIPFFQWILHEPDFLAGKMDTTFLDRMLAERAGRPFQEVSAESEEAAVIGAALCTYLRARAASSGGGGKAGETSSLWKRAARLEGLRS